MADLSAHTTQTHRASRRANAARAGEIQRVSTAWGYRLVAGGRVAHAAPALELAAFAAMVICGGLIVGMWALPGATFDAQTIGIKALLSISLGLSAIAFYHLGARGMAREVQMDHARKQVRLVWRNRKDAFVLANVVSFDEVSSMFVKRPQLRGGKAHLCLRYGSEQVVMDLLSGDQEDMQALWNHLRWDIRHGGVEPEVGVAADLSKAVSASGHGKEMGAGVSEAEIRHRIAI